MSPCTVIGNPDSVSSLVKEESKVIKSIKGLLEEYSRGFWFRILAKPVKKFSCFQWFFKLQNLCEPRWFAVLKVKYIRGIRKVLMEIGTIALQIYYSNCIQNSVGITYIYLKSKDYKNISIKNTG